MVLQYFIQFQLNIFAILLMIVLLAIIHIRSEVHSFGKQLLKATIMLTIAGLIIEPLTWIFDGADFWGGYFLEYSTNFFLFLIAPAIGGMMLTYVDYHLHRDRSKVERRFYYQYWTLFTLLILILNFFIPLYFHVDMDSISYHSGDYSWFHFVVLSSMYIYMVAYLIRYQRIMISWKRNVYITFFSLPIIGMFIQLINSRLFFAWTSIAIVLLVVYTFMESTNGERDYLTNLFTRRSYEMYVTNLLERQQQFGIVLIDIDDFKHINDEYGHHVGDQVLVGFGKILQHAFYPNELVVRLAGDEFLIVLEASPKTLDHYKELIGEALKKSHIPQLQNLKFSCGYQSMEVDMSLDHLYHFADQKMYAMKKTQKGIN